jgi:hypothetical protein
VSDEILPVPPIPDGLREAAQTGTLVPFIGAGASQIAGCPSWSSFADSALRFFVMQNKFSHSQLAQIGHLNPRVKLSIARGLQEELGLPIDFGKILYPSGRNVNPKGRQLYASLSKLGKTFITTNYDEWLDEQIENPLSLSSPAEPSKSTSSIVRRHIFYRTQDLTAANLNLSNSVIHLHGSVLDSDSMILTTADYIRHYANDRSYQNSIDENLVLTFLSHLFQEKTILFVGYGLEELEILEYKIAKARHPNPEARHYILQPFFSHERELMRSMRRYYLRDCGIELIPYLRDQKDWEQLLDVLEDFAEKVPASDLIYLQEFKEMADLLDV